MGIFEQMDEWMKEWFPLPLSCFSLSYELWHLCFKSFAVPSSLKEEVKTSVWSLSPARLLFQPDLHELLSMGPGPACSWAQWAFSHIRTFIHASLSGFPILISILTLGKLKLSDTPGRMHHSFICALLKCWASLYCWNKRNMYVPSKTVCHYFRELA